MNLDYRHTKASRSVCWRSVSYTDILASLSLSDRSSFHVVLLFYNHCLQANFRIIVAGTTASNLEISVSWKNRVRVMGNELREDRHTNGEHFVCPKIGALLSSFKLPSNRN